MIYELLFTSCYLPFTMYIYHVQYTISYHYVWSTIYYSHFILHYLLTTPYYLLQTYESRTTTAYSRIPNASWMDVMLKSVGQTTSILSMQSPHPDPKAENLDVLFRKSWSGLQSPNP